MNLVEEEQVVFKNIREFIKLNNVLYPEKTNKEKEDIESIENSMSEIEKRNTNEKINNRIQHKQ